MRKALVVAAAVLMAATQVQAAGTIIESTLRPKQVERVNMAGYGLPNIFRVEFNNGELSNWMPECCGTTCQTASTAAPVDPPATTVPVPPTMVVPPTDVPVDPPVIVPDPTDQPSPKGNCGVGQRTPDGDTKGCPSGSKDGIGTAPGAPGAKKGNGNPH